MCLRRSTTMVNFRQRTTVVGFGRKNNSGRYLTVVSRRNRLFTHPAQRRLAVEGHLGEAPIRVVLWCIRGGHPGQRSCACAHCMVYVLYSNKQNKL